MIFFNIALKLQGLCFLSEISHSCLFIHSKMKCYLVQRYIIKKKKVKKKVYAFSHHLFKRDCLRIKPPLPLTGLEQTGYAVGSAPFAVTQEDFLVSCRIILVPKSKTFISKRLTSIILEFFFQTGQSVDNLNIY